MELKTSLFILALLSISSAATLLEQAPAALGGTVVLVVIILAITAMVAEAINAQQLHAWVKQEYRELIVAAILFVLVMALFNVDKPIMETLSGTDDYKEDAEGVIDDMMGRATVAYKDLIDAYFVVGMRSGYSTNVMAGYYVWVSVGGVPSSGFSSFMIFFNQAAGGLTNMIILYSALRAVLGFCLSTMGQLIYLAFIFRVIPFTRQVGSTLIALVIGGYVIFPLAVFLLAPAHDLINVPAPNLDRDMIKDLEFYLPSGASLICGEWWMRMLVGMFGEVGFALPPCLLVAAVTLGTGFQPCWEVLTKVVYPIMMQIILPILWGLTMAISTFVTPDLGKHFDHFAPFLREINNLVVVSYVDAILVIIITYAGIRSVSAALGGEYMLPGIQRLV
ncbi:MAG: hypothetical protein V1827_01665 [Candidatus Micrarchaeota archaeon]